MLDKVTPGIDPVQCSRQCKQFLVFRHSLFTGILLQNNQVAAHFRVGVFGKEVVRQTDGGNKACLFQHFKPYRFVARGVHYPLRCKERHDAAIPYRVDTFQEEIVVYGFLCRLACGAVAHGKCWVEDRHLSKRHIGYGKVESTVERFFYFFKSRHPYLVFRVEVREKPACQQVFLKCHHVRLRRVFLDGRYERTHPR